MLKEEYQECLALLNAWFEDPEYAEQGHFNRAVWAIKKLASSLNYELIDPDGNHQA